MSAPTFPYDPEMHIIPFGLEATSWLQNHFQDPDLFVCFHKRAGNWCISRWVHKYRLLKDLVIIGKSLSMLDRDTVKHLDDLDKGEYVNASKELASSEKAFWNNLQAQFDEDREVEVDLARRTGMGDLPYYADEGF